MQSLANKITDYCIRRNIIEEDARIWFQYGIEKRLSTIVVAIPFFMLALFLTNIVCAVTYYLSFYWLRTRTNGFHAKTVGCCFIVSLLAELIYCGILYRFLVHWEMLIYVSVSGVLIFVFAPFNHPNLNLSEKDIVFCKKQSRFRIICLSTIALLCLVVGFLEATKGIVLGTSMAALMLIIPYILQKGVI